MPEVAEYKANQDEELEDGEAEEDEDMDEQDKDDDEEEADEAEVEYIEMWGAGVTGPRYQEISPTEPLVSPPHLHSLPPCKGNTIDCFASKTP